MESHSDKSTGGEGFGFVIVGADEAAKFEGIGQPH
jgi:hypothetical protein